MQSALNSVFQQASVTTTRKNCVRGELAPARRHRPLSPTPKSSGSQSDAKQQREQNAEIQKTMASTTFKNESDDMHITAIQQKEDEDEISCNTKDSTVIISNLLNSPQVSFLTNRHLLLLLRTKRKALSTMFRTDWRDNVIDVLSPS